MPLRMYIANFWARVTVAPAGCALWQGPTSGKGYGHTHFAGRPAWAHRVAYRLSAGFLPSRLHVCHRCDIKLCVNPAHLFLGTAADNNRDMLAKGRTAKGEKSGQAKLTARQVLSIRADRRLGVDIAATYGVSKALVSMIKKRRVWAHL